MKYFGYIMLLLFISQSVVAQKLVDQVISKDDRKKVEQARKLFNEYKIFEGEKILKELVRMHPKEVYFYEALVQMQRQVLYRITDATGELQQMNLSKSERDSLDLDSDPVNDATENSNTKPVDEKEIFESLGLDMAKINTKDEARKKNRADEVTGTTEDEITDGDEATVTIDSNLIFTEEEIAEFARKAPGASKKIDKKTQRKLRIIESFAQIPYEQYLYDLIQNARNATRLFINADSSSLYLRQFLIDSVDVNEFVKPEAWTEYMAGLEDYYDKIIPGAAKHFEKALELDNYFYLAYIKLGDVYYLMNKDTASIQQYRYAAILFPMKPEPYEKLAIMQYNRGRYTDAAATIIEAMMKYPQSHYLALLKRIVEKTGREFNPQWVPREVFPLSVMHLQEEIVVNDKSPWWHYQAARQDVFNYFDSTGILIDNAKTKERYLEVYSWKKMLTNTSPKYFQFARAMEKVGYLDCYVLLTCFHNDLYGQFKDFVTLNPDKIKKYYYLLLNWDDKKFEKLKKSVEVPEKKPEEKVKETKKK